MMFRRRDPIGGPLPESDVFSVARAFGDGGTVFQVAHYPTRDAIEACCHVRIAQQPDESETQALTRAAIAIEGQHS
jgi:hypothetical protein